MKCERCGNEMEGKSSDILGRITMYFCSCGNKRHEFEEVLKKAREEIMKEEFRYLDQEISSISPIINKEVEKQHWRITSEYVRRAGKHIRSTLILLSNEALGGKREEGIKTGAAMEMCENWILIHDDIEDNSLSRRGGETLHVMYDIPLAINAGDSLHLIMWKLLIDNKKVVGEEKAHKIMERFYQILFRTTVGQTAELLLMKKSLEEVKEDDFYYVVDGKTGFYSIAGPLILGSIIAGKDEERIIKSFSEFGLYLGRAFQIADDVLDITSDFRGLKKQKGNDIYEGKRTLLLLHLMKHANSEEKERIKEIMDKPREEKSNEEVEYIISLMEKYKSIEYAMEKAKEFSKKAKEILEKMDFFENKEAKDKLMLAVDFIINRDH